jgi:mRNA interferase MazF
MRKGDIWLINLDPTIGAEIKKTRPAVIVSEARRGDVSLGGEEVRYLEG